jgi:hypothetical protein
MAYAWRREFLERQPMRDMLVIDRDSLYWIAERVAATPILQAQLRKEGIAYHMRNHSFSAVYVYQTFTVNQDTGELTLAPEETMGPDYELAPVAQRRTHLLQIGRFSRVVAIRDGTKILAQADTTLKSLDSELSPEQLATAKRGYVEPDMRPEQLEAAKREYLDRFVRELP